MRITIGSIFSDLSVTLPHQNGLWYCWGGQGLWHSSSQGSVLMRTLPDTQWPDPGELELMFSARTTTQPRAESLGFCACEHSLLSTDPLQQIAFTGCLLYDAMCQLICQTWGHKAVLSFKWVRRQQRGFFFFFKIYLREHDWEEQRKREKTRIRLLAAHGAQCHNPKITTWAEKPRVWCSTNCTPQVSERHL